MEEIHGVDVSWLHHSKKGHSQKPADSSAPNSPIAPDDGAKDPAPEVRDRQDIRNGTPTSGTDGEASQHHQHHIHRPHFPTRGASDGPASPAQASPKGAKDGKPTPSTGRRNSWMSSLSSKFSSNTSPQPATSIATSPQANKSAQSPHLENFNAYGAAVTPGDKEVNKTEAGASAPPSPSSKSGHPSFLQSAFRRLSSSGAAGLGKATGAGTVCPRRVMNIDPYRERCDISALQPAKLRRVSFSVDVEIAPPARYSEEEPEEPQPPPPPPPGRRPSLTQLENQVESKKKKDRKLKQGEGAALRSPNAVAEEKDSKGVVEASGENLDSQKLVAAGSIETEGTKDTSRKKEKKKRSEGERKERKERKRNEALAKGEVPRELRKENSNGNDAVESSTGADTPPKSQDRPTTDPLRIYRRCCQLRETRVLKRITEQISSPSACAIATPGTILCLDLSGFWMQLPDIVTLSDYLAVVPVKKLILEDCGLSDEAVRVILAGLLAAKTAEQARHNRKLSKKTIEQIKTGKTEDLGVVEKISLKNNPKIGKEGWRHICLFLYMSKTLKAIDVSGISLPQSQTGSSSERETSTDTAGLLSRVIAERPAGSRLEELVMSECGLTDGHIVKLVDAVMQCGLTRLGLASNEVSEQALHHILHYLRSGKCEGLDLGGNNLSSHVRMLSDALDGQNPLYALSLADCNLDASALEILFPALERLPNFRFLDLSHNRKLFAAQPNALHLLRKYLPRLPIIKRLHLCDVAMSSEHAIALAEVLPEVKNLAHLNILENHLLVPLASAEDEASQEEACALYASLMAAVRVSSTIICIDMEVPSQNSSEVVKALAKQVVAYSLRNLERVPLTEGSDPAVADPRNGEKNVTVPDVLLHLVGHVEGFPEDHDDDEPAPDDDYIVGGTGVVKALGVCLNRSKDSRRHSRDITPVDSGTVTPKKVLHDDELKKGKAKEMSKNLLGSARKIRSRLQPALVKEARAGDAMNYKRLQFLDSTLERMIQRFEEEYPETRLQPSAAAQTDQEDLPSPPERGSLDDASPVSHRSEAFGANNEAEWESNNGVRRASMTRRGSDVSLASRQAQEEGQMHRFGQRMRREILRPQTLDHAHGTTGEEKPEAQHLRELRERIEKVPGEEIRQKMSELGPDGLFEAIGTTAEELKALEERDPMIREGRLMELYNAQDAWSLPARQHT
ncbi:MAG: hypothetical protein Q9191_003632 [Dirinaria sp. TL-2023a]